MITARSTAGGGVGIDGLSRTRVALGLVTLWLAVEPALRALIWWDADKPTHRLLHADVHWLVIGLTLLVLDQARAELRRQLAARRWLLPVGLLWAAGALLPVFVGDASPVSLRWPVYLAFGLALLGALRQRPEDGPPLLVAGAGGFLGLAIVVAAFATVTPLDATIDWVAEMPGAPNVRNLAYEGAAVAVAASLYRPAGAASPWTALLRVAAVAAWAFIFWSGARGALLASLAALVIGIAAARPGGRRRHAAEALLLMAAGAGLSLLHTPPNASFGFWRTLGMSASVAVGSTSDVSSGRLAIWAESVQAIVAHPWIGIGEGAMKRQFVSAFGTYPQPHNVVLQAPLAWGLPAGGAFLAAIALPLVRTGRRLACAGSVGSPALAAGTAALALAGYALIDGTLYHPRPTILFLIFAAIAVTAPAFDKARPAP